MLAMRTRYQPPHRAAKWKAGCRYCWQEVEFVRHRDTLRPAPLNIGNHPNGNIYVEGDTYIVLTGEVRIRALARGYKLRVNHNVTCKKNPQGRQYDGSQSQVN